MMEKVENRQGTRTYDETGTCDQGTVNDRLFCISAEIHNTAGLLKALTIADKSILMEESLFAVATHLDRIADEIATM